MCMPMHVHASLSPGLFPLTLLAPLRYMHVHMYKCMCMHVHGLSLGYAAPLCILALSLLIALTHLTLYRRPMHI